MFADMLGDVCAQSAEWCEIINTSGRLIRFYKFYLRLVIDSIGNPLHNYLRIDTPPATDWSAGDIITGQTSGVTCEVVSKIDANTYKVKDMSGVYDDGEIIGVTGTPTKLADQGSGYPFLEADVDYTVYTQVNPSTGCLTGSWSCIHKSAGGVLGC